MLKSDVKKEILFSEGSYRNMVNEVHKVLNLTEKEKEILLTHAVPRFIAEIPYMAEQENPEVKAVLNLITYTGGSRNRVFFAQREGQTIEERIDTYIQEGGNSEILSLCKDILEEVSLYDHKNDAETDKKTGHGNPINRGEIDFKTEKRRLTLKRQGYSKTIKKLIEGRFEGEVLSYFWRF